MRRLRALTLSFVLAFTPSLSAHADDKLQSKHNEQYTEAIRRALDEYALGHWSEALSFFSSAHALQPSARTFRGMALASYEMRAYADAIVYFEHALADTDQALTGRLRDEAQRFLAESRMFIADVTVTLIPETAQLKLDSRPIRLPTDGKLMLDVGSHTLTAEAEGYETASQNVVTRGGQPLNVTLQLRTTASAQLAGAAPFVHAEPQPKAAAENQSELGPWLVIGGSGLVAVAGGVFVGVALTSKSSAEHPGTDPNYQAVQDAATRGRTFFPLGFALIGAGAAGIAAGFAWKYWPLFGDSERNTSVSLTPTGVSLRTRF